MFARKARAVRIAVVAVLLTMLIVPASLTSTASAAPALPAGFVLLDQPSGQAALDLTDFAYLPDGTFLTTGKKGKVTWVGPDGISRTIATLSVDSSGDLGLVGLAVAPDYATSRQIYLVRSVPTGGGFVIRTAGWTVTGTAEPTGLTGEKVLVDVPGDGDPFHSGGSIVAAADGTVWVSVGDLGNPGQPKAKSLRALDNNQLQGKILHLTKDGAGVPTNPYFEPANPGSVRSRVYASGFRSPFRMSLDPKTGQPVVGDVGWNTWEELDVVQPGGNYAWPCFEANHPSPGYSGMPGCAGVTNTPPLWEYRHGTAIDQGNCVIGGIVYNGTSYPAKYRGKYFFGDYVAKKLWTLAYDAQGKLTQAPQNPPFATGIGGPVKFAAAPNGDIVFADILSGKVRRLSYKSGNSAPVASATTTTDPATRTVTFDGSGSSDPDGDTLTYTWDFGDGTPSGTGMKSTHTYAPGANTFTATLTVTDPLGLTNTTPPITVAPTNHSPDLVLTDPGSHTFAVGEAVSVSAAATDADEPGTQLPITWTSLVRHCPTAGTCHVHPGVGQTGPTFTLPFVDHPDSRMEFVATATDKAGVSASKTYVARPTDHRLTLVSNVPAALQIPLEGAGVSTAMVTEAAQFTVEAAAVATDGASAFLNWQGGPATRVWPITVGTTDMTLTANYSTAIDQRYNADPALRTMLGTPTGPEVVSGSVSYRVYQNGRLYWSKATGVHELHGTILAAYLNLGGQAKMGPPRTDQTAVSDSIGQFNDFDGTSGTGPASIYWTAKTGAHAVWGRIRVKWAQLGFGKGVLGYPTTDEQVTPDGTGRFNHFSKDASIYWTVGTDAHSVQGRIRARWAAQGWELGQAGYPTTDELSTPDGFGRYNHFTKGASIYWAPPTDAHVVVGVIRDRWAALGWEGSYLGYPTSDEFGIPGGRRSNFQSGFITWNASTGVVIDRRY